MAIKIDMAAMSLAERDEATEATKAAADRAWSKERKARRVVRECEEDLKAAQIQASRALNAAKEAEEAAIMWEAAAHGTRE